MTEQLQEVQRIVTHLYNQSPDWVTFFREILGLEGVVRRVYSTQESLAAFEQTQEYAEIQKMLAKLREKSLPKEEEEKEPTRVITVRLPRSLHATLKEEAREHKTSVNKLCISKLLQVVDEQLVPAEE